MNLESLKMIEELANARGASGFEDEVVSVARRHAAKIADLKEDKMRNLYLYRKNNRGDRPVVMLDAHSDEVGFMVHSIRPNGTLRVVNLGRWNYSTLPGSKMLVRNSEGEWLPAIFANIPAHFRKGNENNDLSVSELSLDVGACSKEECSTVFKIRIGEPVVPAATFACESEKDLLFGKAFDCRIGCAALIETMKLLADEELAVDVVGVLSSQEEVGERGCMVSVNTIKPDVAICFEGCPADDTFSEDYAIQTALKKGPMFRHMDVSAIASPRFQRFIIDLAAAKKLAVQESVREGGGNDAGVIHTACGGIPAVTVGVPVRYIHTTNCITSYYDFEMTAKVVAETVKALSQEIIDRF